MPESAYSKLIDSITTLSKIEGRLRTTGAEELKT